MKARRWHWINCGFIADIGNAASRISPLPSAWLPCWRPKLPSLPEEVAVSVRGHFVDLGKWLERLLELGVEQGSINLEASPDVEAQAFMATVYGAMLAARAV